MTRSKRATWLALLFAFMLQRCAVFGTNTAEDIRQANGAHSTFSVRLDFDTVLSNELYVSRYCMPRELNVGGFVSRYEIGGDGRTAAITYGVEGAFGYHIDAVIDLIDRGSETEIHTFEQKKLIHLADFGQKVKAWAQGTKPC